MGQISPDLDMQGVKLWSSPDLDECREEGEASHPQSKCVYMCVGDKGGGGGAEYFGPDLDMR